MLLWHKPLTPGLTEKICTSVSSYEDGQRGRAVALVNELPAKARCHGVNIVCRELKYFSYNNIWVILSTTLLSGVQ